MGWDMNVYAYRPQGHESVDGKTICLRWDRQMPSPVGDWMLAWAVEEGSDAALARAKDSCGDLASSLFHKDAWPEPYKSYESRRHMWRLRHEYSDAMCDMCKWFYDGPCGSNKIVIDRKNVHHSFGCSGDLMMSDWFVRNLWVGEDATVDAHGNTPEWIKWYDDDGEPTSSWPMFCETQKSQNLQSWNQETLCDARRRISYLGKPVKQCDVDALEETLDVLAWAERHLLADDGVKLVCLHDF